MVDHDITREQLFCQCAGQSTDHAIRRNHAQRTIAGVRHVDIADGIDCNGAWLIKSRLRTRAVRTSTGVGNASQRRDCTMRRDFLNDVTARIGYIQIAGGVGGQS